MNASNQHNTPHLADAPGKHPQHASNGVFSDASRLDINALATVIGRHLLTHRGRGTPTNSALHNVFMTVSPRRWLRSIRSG